jgi:hypothetical protein
VKSEKTGIRLSSYNERASILNNSRSIPTQLQPEAACGQSLSTIYGLPVYQTSNLHYALDATG